MCFASVLFLIHIKLACHPFHHDNATFLYKKKVHQHSVMSQVEFASGDIVRMFHKAKGVDGSGKLKMEVVLEGNVPEIDASTEVVIKVVITLV